MRLKYLIYSSLVLLLAAPQLQAQRVRHLGNVVVTANRPMKDIGVQKTTFDSLALKENISLSMADILTYNSSIFVKSYGRATLSTVAFRGTSPSHTQVTWNGMKINSPMLGMTDFSTIPSYFIDDASLLHGSSSILDAGGGLGGLVRLGTTPDISEGFGLQYIQGIGSFRTFDEFLKFNYGSEHWKSSTRVVYSSSPNDYKYVNHDKKVNVYDDEHNIIAQYHPTERNRSGAFADLHLLQEVYYDSNRGDRLALKAWYVNSNRELPLLSTDYGDGIDFENRQREQTLRGVLSWAHIGSGWSTDLRAGYIHTRMAYDYRRGVGGAGEMATMTRSRSRVNTFYGQAKSIYAPTDRWLFNFNLSAHQHLVRSEDKKVETSEGSVLPIGYDVARIEMSASASATWKPTDRIGLSAVLREELSVTKMAPLIPAFYFDALLSPRGNVTAKASVAKNYKFPSLNDLYFMPGGNPDLKNEHGYTYDAGLSFAVGRDRYSLSGSATWFDSRVNDWILWLPTPKGFFSPRNVKDVHAYGIEAKGNLMVRIARDWLLDLDGSFAWTRSINVGPKMSEADKSIGKQLPYVPEYSSSINGRLTWKEWSLAYRWAYYSERYTMSSNEPTISGHLPTYFMSNVSLGRKIDTRIVAIDLKFAVNNLFNEDYISVLSRPMPGINFEFFIGLSPKFRKSK